jgi:8-oxo-dGTP pyrophosphatase MutT (NUDIX family)
MHAEKKARAIIVCNSHLLTLKPQEKDIFFTPGGRVEKSETLIEALLREISEELPAVIFELGPRLGTIEHTWQEPSGKKMTAIHHFFRIYAPGLSASVVPPSVEKGLAFVWIHVDELSAYPLQPPSLKVLVPKLLAGSKVSWMVSDNDKQ